jgi:hypothetical protein
MTERRDRTAAQAADDLGVKAHQRERQSRRGESGRAGRARAAEPDGASGSSKPVRVLAGAVGGGKETGGVELATIGNVGTRPLRRGAHEKKIGDVADVVRSCSGAVA